MEEHKKQTKKNDYGTRIFLFGLEVIFYFGIPAVLGIFLGKWISSFYPDKTKEINIFILFLTYIVSWLIVYFRFKQIKNKYSKDK